jgi:hypothetical protein
MSAGTEVTYELTAFREANGRWGGEAVRRTQPRAAAHAYGGTKREALVDALDSLLLMESLPTDPEPIRLTAEQAETFQKALDDDSPPPAALVDLLKTP